VVAYGLASYLLMATLSFAAVTLVRVQTGGEEVSSFQGLHQRSPFLAFVVLVSMASLAGVPLTAGFVSKAFVFWFAVQAHAWFLLAVAVVSGAAGFYYYFKVIRAAYMQPPAEAGAGKIEVSPAMRLLLIGLVIAVFYFGVAPQPLFNLAPKAKVASVQEP
jgi:NADH-quinone oxidoreductase subunit N